MAGWRENLVERAGGADRLRVVVLLAAVLGLSGADTGTVAAVASNLERAFSVSNTDIGVLLSVVMLVGAAGTVPVGALTDRVTRTRLLALSISLWAGATVLSAMATSFAWLLAARVVLGVVTATAGPTVASLTGDFFPAAERGRIYGWIVSGELTGVAMGLVISGIVAEAAGWRAAVGWAALPSVGLAWAILRLPEPVRGGGGQLHASVPAARGARQARPAGADLPAPAGGALGELGLVDEIAEQRHIRPYPGLVLQCDPADRSLWWAVRYVLRVRTNVVIIVASALAYFYLSGVEGFALLYAQRHYGISKAVATLVVVLIGAGAVAGVISGGRASDKLLHRGILNARVIVPLAALAATVPFMAAGFLSGSLAIAVPLLIIGAFFLGSADPPGDAARLDIIHPHLWGRSEGIRTFLRTLLQAIAPAAFGFASDHWFGSPGGTETGLGYTFVLFLAVLALGALAIAPALRSYPRDVATADASIRAVAVAAERCRGRPQAVLRNGTPPATPSGHGRSGTTGVPPATAGGTPVRCCARCYPTGVKSREAMKGGRGAGAAYGSSRAFSTLLNTTNTFDRGNGVMLLFEPCMQLQSNSVAEPAGPENCSMPCLSASVARLAGSGVPISWFRSDFL